MSDNKLKVKLVPSGFSDLSKQSKEASKSLGQLESSQSSLIKNNVLLTKSLGLAKKGFLALGVALISSVPRTNNLIKSTNQLSKALQNSTKLSKESVLGFQNLAKEMSHTTGFSRLLIEDLFTMGANAELSKDKILELSNTALSTMSATGSEATDVMKDLILTTKDGGSAISLLEQNFIAVSEAERVWLQQLTEAGDTTEAVTFAVNKLNKAYRDATSNISENELETKRAINTLNDLRGSAGLLVSAFSTPALKEFNIVMEGMADSLISEESIEYVSSSISGLNVVFDKLKPAVISMASVFNELFLTVVSLSQGFFQLAQSNSIVSESLDFLGASAVTAFQGIVGGGKQFLALFQGDLQKSVNIGNESVKKINESWAKVGDIDNNFIDDFSDDLKKAKKESDRYFDNLLKQMKSTSASARTEFPKVKDAIEKNIQKPIDNAEIAITALGTNFGSIGSIITNSLQKTFQDTSAIFDEQLDELEAKEQDRLAVSSENETVASEKRIAFLELEKEKAIESGDKLTESAIKNEQKKLKNELSVIKKEEEAVKKFEKEKANIVYKRAFSENENNVAIAENNAKIAKADAVISVTQSVLNATAGIARAFSEGGLIGFGLGSAAAATIIGSATSAASSVDSATANVEAVKAQAPTPPQFAYGTFGYGLGLGESAIVGERGAEVVTNKSGKLQVESTEMTRRNLESVGDVINIYVYTDTEESIATKVKEELVNYKERIFNTI